MLDMLDLKYARGVLVDHGGVRAVELAKLCRDNAEAAPVPANKRIFINFGGLADEFKCINAGIEAIDRAIAEHSQADR